MFRFNRASSFDTPESFHDRSMFWNAWSVEGHDEQEGKDDCLGDEYVHGEGADSFWLHLYNEPASQFRTQDFEDVSVAADLYDIAHEVGFTDLSPSRAVHEKHRRERLE
jgi:hypothetical protein